MQITNIDYNIRQVKNYKDKTFCLSVVGGAAYWSIHKGVFDLNAAKASAQRVHNEQVLSMVREHWQNNNILQPINLLTNGNS